MYVLFITHASGYVQTVTFSTACARALAMITLAPQPLILRTRYL